MKFLVVCPTSKGGHLEHAVNMASALGDHYGHPSTLLTSRGAGQYLSHVAERIHLEEALAPNSPGQSRYRSLLRLLAHNLTVTWYLVRNRKAFDAVVFEEPRFPVAPLVARVMSLPLLILFVHNVENHSATKQGVWARFQSAMQQFIIPRVDACLVHGSHLEAHEALARAKATASVPLPGAGAFEASTTSSVRPAEVKEEFESFDLCLGEIRENKGALIAAKSALIAHRRLIIAGEPVDPDYLATICATTSTSSLVTIIDRFLSPEEFAWLLEAADRVVIPYTHFGAQSGIASRAMSAEKFLLTSDLETLTHQTRNYSAVATHSAGDADELALQLKSSSAYTIKTAEFANAGSTWADVAISVERLVHVCR